MTRNDIIHNALAGAFWDCNASPNAMVRAAMKATGNEDIPDDLVRQIERAINRAMQSARAVDFGVLVSEVAKLLPVKPEEPKPPEGPKHAANPISESRLSQLEAHADEGGMFQASIVQELIGHIRTESGLMKELAEAMENALHRIEQDDEHNPVDIGQIRAVLARYKAKPKTPAPDDDDDGKPPACFAHLFDDKGNVL